MPAELHNLFGDGTRTAELYGPGDPSSLLPAEVQFLGSSVPKRAQEFAAGRVCARRALADLGIHDFPIEMAADRQPIWPQGVVGSITHTQGYCAAAVAFRDAVAAIGLDSEARSAVEPHLWPNICLPVEIEWLRSLPEEQQREAATLIFSAKEAFYKCQYPAVLERLHFHDAHVEIADWRRNCGVFTINATREIAFAVIALLPMTGQYLFHREFSTVALYVAAPAA